MRAVYDALHVDCGMLSAGAAAWFGASRPRNFFEVGDTPVTKRFHVGGMPVAVILFPPLSAGGTPETEAPTPKLLASVLAAADAASDAAIRIGISPWGFEGEFAVREALEQRYHLLLGGGPGAAFAGEVNAQAPGLIWSRADKDGRSVMAIDIMALPEPGVPFAWEWGLLHAGAGSAPHLRRPVQSAYGSAGGREGSPLKQPRELMQTRRPCWGGAFLSKKVWNSYCWRPLRNESLRKPNAFRLATSS